MWRYHPDLLATPVPRYTSFPTAAEFSDDVGPRDMAAALATVGADEGISLYLHIPYCREICWYCGCNTGAANRSGRVSAYLQRLAEEIDLVGARLGGRGVVRRIAWGGGSPNAIAPEEFDALMHRIATAFRCDDPVVSIEIDPRGFDWNWAAALARHNVSRVSLGVQTFAPHIQAAIGRIQPIEEIACVVTQLRAAFVGSINFDLMYGLPGQSVADLATTLDEAIALQPDRLAVFGYAHVPHLLPRQRQIDATALPDAATRFEQAAMAHARLAGAGYQPIGFDHFALPEDEIARAARAGALRRNFQGFTEDPSRILLGLGASAISAFPGWLLQNEKNAGRYHLRIGNGGFATARGLRRTAQDQRIGAAIEQLLCRGDADLRALPGLAEVRDRLAPFEQHGLVAWNGGHVSIAADAVPYARAIVATLDPYRGHSAVRFSNAV
ncbi:oxygen-independent coproporphyrinogen III oxidase [Sphingomonas sp. ZT3P38]|uniref:oxygen-independent coproporphyrinogen III oxidase n=1 Tax=Parasphingomonas zepuensis TaxID=3096161 RepID=UPI002FC78409